MRFSPHKCGCFSDIFMPEINSVPISRGRMPPLQCWGHRTDRKYFASPWRVCALPLWQEQLLCHSEHSSTWLCLPPEPRASADGRVSHPCWEQLWILWHCLLRCVSEGAGGLVLGTGHTRRAQDSQNRSSCNSPALWSFRRQKCDPQAGLLSGILLLL